jgi:hypothetical protein
VRYASTLGGTLKSGERIITTKIFRDTTANFPENWDLHLVDTSYGIGRGLPTPGFTKDFDGNLIGNTPSIGLYQQTGIQPTPCTFTYGTWDSCINGIQTRSYTTSPTGCSGTPPIDSIQRTCTPPIVTCTFTYGTWTSCSNGTQKRTYTSAPTGCTGVPSSDSITRTCITPTCNFTYGQWSTCNNGSQTRTYSSSPTGCVGSPNTDSVFRSCTNPIVITKFIYNSANIRIRIICNTAGIMTVSNVLGSIVRNYSYAANGASINVSGLPSGTYFATTYGQSITFIR